MRVHLCLLFLAAALAHLAAGFVIPSPGRTALARPVSVSVRTAGLQGSSSGGRQRAGARGQLAMQRYEEAPVGDRLLSAAPYILPIADGIGYSKFLAFYFPDVFNPIYAALDPFLAVYKASPFINLAVYLLIVWVGRQPSLSRYVRFNFQQAIILDVALVIPSIFSGLMRQSAAPVWVQEPFSNFLFFVLTACIGYVFVKIALGEKPGEIPIISEATDMSLGPF